jgi:hypothetical protein
MTACSLPTGPKSSLNCRFSLFRFRRGPLGRRAPAAAVAMSHFKEANERPGRGHREGFENTASTASEQGLSKGTNGICKRSGTYSAK